MKRGSPEKIDRDEIIRRIEESIPAMRAFARGLCYGDMVADDLVQSACERALKRLHHVNDITGIHSWLNRIVYTQWQDTLRRRQRRKNKLFLLGRQEEIKVGDSRSNKENEYIAKLDVDRALKPLSEEHRAAVVLVSMLGYEYDEVANILGVPIGTVASRVARARSLMAKHLHFEKKQRTDPSVQKEASK